MNVVDILKNSPVAWQRGLAASAAVAALVLCVPGHAQETDCDRSPSAGSTAARDWLDDAGQRREALFDAMRKKLQNLHATDNADYDFAALQQIYAATAVKMAQEELRNGQDSEMRAQAKRVLKAQATNRTKIDHWLDQFHRYD